MKYRPWTPEEIEILKREYPTSDLDELAARLDRTPIAVRNRYNAVSREINGASKGHEAPFVPTDEEYLERCRVERERHLAAKIRDGGPEFRPGRIMTRARSVSMNRRRNLTPRY